jgi:hypothetical protein
LKEWLHTARTPPALKRGTTPHATRQKHQSHDQDGFDRNSQQFGGCPARTGAAFLDINRATPLDYGIDGRRHGNF